MSWGCDRIRWTPVGGEAFFIEVSKMPGRGKLILTGQLVRNERVRLPV